MSLRFFCYGVVALLLTLVVAAAPGHAAPNFIHADGTQLVDAQGERFAVKGINLGNWLVPEGYMFRFARKRAPSEIAEVIEALVGPEEAARFWAAFREDYVTQADIRFIKAAGLQHRAGAAALAAVRRAGSGRATAAPTHSKGRAGRCSIGWSAGAATQVCA